MGEVMSPDLPPTRAELAAGPLDDSDRRVLQHLAQLFEQSDPMPKGLGERTKFAISLDALHAEVAELQRSDSLAGVRGDDAAGAQTVTFTSATLTTMITITPTSIDGVRIDGWIAPGGGVAVELRSVDQSLPTTADGDGRFVFEHVGHGLVRFVLRPPAPADAPPVVTPSIEI
jgi:hypothetical protein